MNEHSITHGKFGTKVYWAWSHMIQRCTNKNSERFPHYGGRGILPCEEWLKFENFYADMGDPPEGTTLDRKDNDLGYFKDNCRWATQDEQNNNKQDSLFIEFDGRTKTLKKWSEEIGINYRLLWARIKVLGWSVNKAFTTPARITSKK
jgi:hypothetical protein